MRSRRRQLVLLAALMLPGLACAVHLGGPQPPGVPIPVSTDAAGQLAELWASAERVSGTGEAALIINEAQLTSYFTYALALQSDPPIREPQVYLQDGLIKVYGTVQGDYYTANALVELTATADEDGKLLLTVQSADFGPLPVPASLLDSLSSAMTAAFTGELGPLATGIQLTSLAIVNGEMAITGSFR